VEDVEAVLVTVLAFEHWDGCGTERGKGRMNYGVFFLDVEFELYVAWHGGSDSELRRHK